MRIHSWKPLKITAGVLLSLAFLHLVQGQLPKKYWFNLRESEPPGLYRMEKLDGTLKRGELVIMKVPAGYRHYVYGRGWIREGWTLFKEIGGLPGDTFCVA